MAEQKWTAARMVGSDGSSLTAEQIGEYVTRTIRNTVEDSGVDEFVFVWCPDPDGDGCLDVCHVGNGPRRWQHARLIAESPNLLAALRALLAVISDSSGVIDYRGNGNFAPWSELPEFEAARQAVAALEEVRNG